MRGKRHLAAVALLFSVAGVQACAGEDFETAPAVEPNCPEDLFSCGEGLTCWIGGEPGQAGSSFLDCFNEGSAGEGEACVLSIGAPTCKKDLFCAQFQGQSQGTCARYCEQQNPDRGCPSGQACQNVSIDVVAVQICL